VLESRSAAFHVQEKDEAPFAAALASGFTLFKDLYELASHQGAAISNELAACITDSWASTKEFCNNDRPLEARREVVAYATLNSAAERVGLHGTRNAFTIGELIELVRPVGLEAFLREHGRKFTVVCEQLYFKYYSNWILVASPWGIVPEILLNHELEAAIYTVNGKDTGGELRKYFLETAGRMITYLPDEPEYYPHVIVDN